MINIRIQAQRLSIDQTVYCYDFWGSHEAHSDNAHGKVISGLMCWYTHFKPEKKAHCNLFALSNSNPGRKLTQSGSHSHLLSDLGWPLHKIVLLHALFTCVFPSASLHLFSITSIIMFPFALPIHFDFPFNLLSALPHTPIP